MLAPGTGLVLTVWVTLLVAVSMTDRLSSLELATSSADPWRNSAVGCRPTEIDWVCLPVARLTTDTVPVVAPPVTLLETIGVPSDMLVNWPGRAGAPPSLETYAVVPLLVSTT